MTDWREHRSPGRRVLHGTRDFVGRAVLEQVTGGADLQRRHDVGLGVERRHDQHRYIAALPDQSSRLDPRHSRAHPQIHDDDIDLRADFLEAQQRLLARAGLDRHRHGLAPVHQGAQTCAHDGMVIDDHHLYPRHCASHRWIVRRRRTTTDLRRARRPSLPRVRTHRTRRAEPPIRRLTADDTCCRSG